MNIKFLGAARQVTGSMFLVELDDKYKILVDCGVDMETKRDLDVISKPLFPFNAPEIDLVILSHAHLDHSGRIPNLFRYGYRGQVLCTEATMDLTKLLLDDSASIYASKFKKLEQLKNRPKEFTKRLKTFDKEVFYLEDDVRDAVDKFVPIAMNTSFKIREGLFLKLIPTGHLLGAANIHLTVQEEGEEKTLLFSGDIGRKNYPLLPDPSIPPKADTVICETTYGDRLHRSTDDAIDEIYEVIQKACVEKPGRLIIPAFSIGRTQAILFVLNQLNQQGKLPPIKIFADSPLAYRSNQVYEKHWKLLNEEGQDFREKEGTLFDLEHLHYVSSSKESRAISSHAEPCIIISSSGMLEGGRIQHHIRNNLENPYCSILMIGFCAKGTFGHRLMNSQNSVKFGNKDIPVHAEILQTDVFSGHGDKNDLLDFIRSQDKSSKIFLVHGEESSMDNFRITLGEEGYSSVEMPYKNESYWL